MTTTIIAVIIIIHITTTTITIIIIIMIVIRIIHLDLFSQQVQGNRYGEANEMEAFGASARSIDMDVYSLQTLQSQSNATHTQ